MKFLLSILLFPFRLVWRVVSLILTPFKWLFNKLFGAPPPMMLGGAPIDHSAPELLSNKAGVKGQVLYVLISVFFIVAVVWAVNA